MEAKFKAWHNKEKRWLPLSEGTGSDYRVLVMDLQGGYVSSMNNFELGTPVNYAKEDIEIVQYVGLLDKNGTAIYEGDIFDYGHGRVFFIAFRAPKFVPAFINGDANSMIPMEEFEIIGNVFETPELLK